MATMYWSEHPTHLYLSVRRFDLYWPGNLSGCAYDSKALRATPLCRMMD